MSNSEIIKKGNLSAEILKKGGELISFKKDNREYIWQRDPKFWNRCAPILFPVVGRLKDNRISIEGKEYPMPKHGFVRDMELEVVENNGEDVLFRLTSNTETKKYYPWDFVLDIEFSLANENLEVKITVTNADKKTMIFGLGGHPAIKVPMYQNDAFDDYRLEFEKDELLESDYVKPDFSVCADKKVLITDDKRTINLKRSLFNNDAMIFENINSSWVKLVNKENKGIKFYFNNFDILAVWTKGEPENAEYVCLEPWNSMGVRDNDDGTIENKFGMKKIKPGESFKADFKIETED